MTDPKAQRAVRAQNAANRVADLCDFDTQHMHHVGNRAED